MNRNDGIDYLRGFIMIFMALDHASAFIARMHFGEMWGVDFKEYPDIAWWFTRFISHLCAPGFFLLMGMGIYYFGQKRLKAGWDKSRITNYFLKRGGIILLLMFFLEFPAWGLGMSFSQLAPEETAIPGKILGSFLIPSTVLFGLGACMMLSSFIWRLNHWWYLFISILSFSASSIYISNADPNLAFHPLEHFLIVPGMSDGAMVIYPIIPWIGITTFGLFLAKISIDSPKEFPRRIIFIGLALLIVFASIRFLGTGNFQKNEFHDFISFFTLIKYPPSLAFVTFTCGINLILLGLFSLMKPSEFLKPIKIFGQTAMFFYIIHLYLYAIVSIAFPMGSSIGIMYLVWLAGLPILYFLCRWFLNFKQGKANDSWWRMI